MDDSNRKALVRVPSLLSSPGPFLYPLSTCISLPSLHLYHYLSCIAHTPCPHTMFHTYHTLHTTPHSTLYTTPTYWTHPHTMSPHHVPHIPYTTHYTTLHTVHHIPHTGHTHTPRTQFEYQQAQLEHEIENLSWKVERLETTSIAVRGGGASGRSGCLCTVLLGRGVAGCMYVPI